MRRNAWVKLWCDLLRHPLLRRRPDCDVRLVIGLLCHVKEHSPEDGAIRGLDAAEMRGLFGIKASVRQVEEGVEYLLRSGWLLLADDGGSLVIKDFVERQKKAGDPPEAQSERAKRYYSNHRDDVLRKRKFSRMVSRENDREKAQVLTHGLTQDHMRSHGSSSHAEVEEEKRKSDLSARSEGRNSQEPVDNSGLEDLTASDRAQVQALLSQGKATEAAALLASLQGGRGIPIQKKSGGVS
jgi:hypothetical protein